MKGHIAFCPHFHQPHFQLYKTREEAYQNSYVPWFQLLESSVEIPGFYINIHFSGPFLYWMRDQKPWFQEKLKTLIATDKIGIIGGLADEPFIQLSSRADDVLYQLQEYDTICSALTGIDSSNWQGIHMVERECGEYLLREVSRASKLMGAFPLYYLDAETFYQSYYSYPGGQYDYCLKHFGFKDPFSKTTIAHIPQEMLYFAMRDEIGGQEYFAVPVHTQARYQLLKTGTFTPEDRTRIKPGQYLFYLKDALEKANEIIQRWGKNIEPIVVVFEDAEKFGQWSKDPQGDTKWMLEFFSRVEDDPEVRFTGLKDYLLSQGILDTYPARTSHSYPEWDNWTAKRGIRGVTFGDERLRRVMSRLRLTEEKQAEFEEKVLDTCLPAMGGHNEGIIRRALMESAERYELISNLLQEHYEPDVKDDYDLIQRTRNLVYQEDPKWASRHPCYGSAPYYDMQGLAYLEIAERMLEKRSALLFGGKEEEIKIRVFDWDFDGVDEIVIQTPCQTICVDLEGGCITYHHVLSENEFSSHKLKEDMKKVVAYNEVYKHAYPLVLTEADSQLCEYLYPEGGRRERCRNAFRAEVVSSVQGEYKKVGTFDTASYHLRSIVKEENKTVISMSASQEINTLNGEIALVSLDKVFTIYQTGIEVKMEMSCKNDTMSNLDLFLVPQIVSSAAPSDEIEFSPHSYLVMEKGERSVRIRGEELMSRKVQTEVYQRVTKELEYCCSGQMEYVFEICNGQEESFVNKVIYNFSSSASNIKQLNIEPAVKQYYQGLVFHDQSVLGYHSSGVMIKPFIPVKQNKASFGVTISWALNQQQQVSAEDNVLTLI